MLVLLDLRGGAFGNDAATVHTCTGTDVDDMIGMADRVLVVLDDDHGVAEIAQPEQRLQQALVVALVQADARLVEHVHHAAQTGADLRRQADAPRFPAPPWLGPARQRPRATTPRCARS